MNYKGNSSYNRLTVTKVPLKNIKNGVIRRSRRVKCDLEGSNRDVVTGSKRGRRRRVISELGSKRTRVAVERVKRYRNRVCTRLCKRCSIIRIGKWLCIKCDGGRVNEVQLLHKPGTCREEVSLSVGRIQCDRDTSRTRSNEEGLLLWRIV